MLADERLILRWHPPGRTQDEADRNIWIVKPSDGAKVATGRKVVFHSGSTPSSTGLPTARRYPLDGCSIRSRENDFTARGCAKGERIEVMEELGAIEAHLQAQADGDGKFSGGRCSHFQAPKHPISDYPYKTNRGCENDPAAHG